VNSSFETVDSSHSSNGVAPTDDGDEQDSFDVNFSPGHVDPESTHFIDAYVAAQIQELINLNTLILEYAQMTLTEHSVGAFHHNKVKYWYQTTEVRIQQQTDDVMIPIFMVPAELNQVFRYSSQKSDVDV